MPQTPWSNGIPTDHREGRRSHREGQEEIITSPLTDSLEHLSHGNNCERRSVCYRCTEPQRVLDAAKHGLECIVEAQLQDVRLRFAADYQAASRRTRLAPDCPDLYSALYYQLARLIVDERPWTNCANCGYPMLLTRPNRKTCSDACRQAKRRRSKATRESSR
jgi:predicted nucleic acid-binding Zn ribbon protein